MFKKWIPYILLIPQIILTILFLVGLCNGMIQSLGVIPALGLEKPTLQYYKEIMIRPDFLQSVFFSLRIAFSSAVIATVGGVVICAAMVMTGCTKGMMMKVVQFPIVIPHVVVALFMINICSQNGIFARIAYMMGLIHDQQQLPTFLYDPNGIGIILAYIWKEIPFVIYFVIALMANINEKLGEAAINLGAGKWTAFCRITLPLCKRTIWSSFLIIFVFSLGAYELPFLLGATKPKALPVLAYIQYTHPDMRNRPYAMALNGIIMIISLACAGGYFLLMKKNTRNATKGYQNSQDERE
ncbi:ABC transporter permease [Lachnospiraceae bacterium LCP25S3_G4]